MNVTNTLKGVAIRTKPAKAGYIYKLACEGRLCSYSSRLKPESIHGAVFMLSSPIPMARFLHL